MKKEIKKVTVLVLCILFTTNLFSQERKQIYLPISVDFQTSQNSKMAIGYSVVNQDTIEQNTTFDGFYRSYKIIRKALEENNYNIAKKFTLNDENYNINTFDADIKYVNKMKKNGTIDTYEMIGNRNYCFFIWGSKNDFDNNNLFLLTFLNKINDSYILSNIPSYSALLLLDIYRQKNMENVKNNTQFKYRIPLQDNTKHEILTLLFNGEKYDEKNHRNNSIKVKRIVDFYNQLKNILKESDTPEKYASYFTEGSKEKILDGYKTNKLQFEAYRQYQINNIKDIKFVIYAEPFYIVFYIFKNRPHNFYYEYIIDNDDELKITNSGFISDLDWLISANLEVIIKETQMNEAE